MRKAMCANGCDAPVSPPSKVICRACQDEIGKRLQMELDYRTGKGPRWEAPKGTRRV